MYGYEEKVRYYCTFGISTSLKEEEKTLHIPDLLRSLKASLSDPLFSGRQQNIIPSTLRSHIRLVTLEMVIRKARSIIHARHQLMHHGDRHQFMPHMSRGNCVTHRRLTHRDNEQKGQWRNRQRRHTQVDSRLYPDKQATGLC